MTSSLMLEKAVLDYLHQWDGHPKTPAAVRFLESFESQLASVPEQLFACAHILLTQNMKDDGWLHIYPQHEVGPYRLDFAIICSDHFESQNHPYSFSDQTLTIIRAKMKRLAIEIDGFAWHDRTPEMQETERKWERYIQQQDWTVIRFAAQEILRDPEDSVIELHTAVKKEVQAIYDLMSTGLSGQ